MKLHLLPMGVALAVCTATPLTAQTLTTWNSPVNVTASAGTLTKSGGCDGCPDSGAVSVQIIPGDGYMEFTASETSALRYIGLAWVNAGKTPAQIRYGLALQPGGIVEVREYGVYRTDTPFAPGDVLRIAVKARVVTYYKNGTLLYTSRGLSTRPLLVDVSLLSTGSTVKQVVTSGSR